MNDAPAGSIYVLSYTPGGYSLVPTPQSGTSRNPKAHSEGLLDYYRPIEPNWICLLCLTHLF